MRKHEQAKLITCVNAIANNMTFNSYGKAIVLLTQQSLKTVCKGYKMPLNLMEMLLYNNSNNTNSNNNNYLSE